jgi:aspartyl-tRNA synthetase
MMDSPSEVNQDQLKELKLKVEVENKKWYE